MSLKNLAKYPDKRGIQIVFFISQQKHILWVPIRSASMSTQKMRFSAEIRKYQHFLLEKKVPYLEL